MYVEPKETSVSFRCVGTSQSAYCDFTFFDNFFSSYDFDNVVEREAYNCKISMRSALTVFKSPTMIEKLVETCHIKLEPNADTLIFIFKFKNSVVKTFFLPIIDCEDLSVPFSKDNVPNKLTTSSRVLTGAVHNFQSNLIELTVDVTPQKLLMRNYVDESSMVENSTRTQLTMSVCEFDKYDIGQDACITFCMKELRALLTFAESIGTDINLYFDTTGKPVVFDLKNPAFEANLVLSTLNPDSDDMSVSTAQDIRQTSRKRTSKRTPRQPAKTSTRRPSNKSASSSKSTSSRSKSSSSIVAETNTRYQTGMEVDEPPEVDRRNSTVVSDKTNSSIRQNVSNGGVRRVQETKEHASSSHTPSSSRRSSSHFSPVVSSLRTISDRETASSIFSANWNKAPTDDPSPIPMDEDTVPASPPPPAKKAKLIFKKCFQTTFDPSTLPGHDDVLADDTDDEM